ncbi:hypothetical protein C1H46_011643 [Malus baccata]|uniref:Uncharacterized protein n=1 Tax=Malus baccata TaxID=106549 RepID=A0A540MVF9_MALBA|nr:hypothetical protein C1H46_011643 [Malus baccata]
MSFCCYVEWAHEYGPIISMWKRSTLNMVVLSLELAKEVLKEHDQKMEDLHRSRSVVKFSKDGQDVVWADYGPTTQGQEGLHSRALLS